LEFLRLCCEDISYVEIANRMCVSPRTVDGYRDDLFRITGVRSRVGLIRYAIVKKYVTPKLWKLPSNEETDPVKMVYL
jgi:two-component system invasion response regulator UvrY